MYTHIDDHDNLEKMADMVLIPVKHLFSSLEKVEKSEQIASLLNEIELEEALAKQTAAEHKNKIAKFKAEVKISRDHINNGFMNVDRPATMYRDFEKSKRVYFDKQTGDFLREEDFHAADFQKKIDFEASEAKLAEGDKIRQMHIEENNQVGDFADGTDMFADIDNVIVDKHLGNQFQGDDKGGDELPE